MKDSISATLRGAAAGMGTASRENRRATSNYGTKRARPLLQQAAEPELALRELQIGLAQAVDEHAHEGFVEGDLAPVRGGAQGIGLDLEDRDGIDGHDCRGA